MKFTKEQALESLKRELTNNGRKTLRMSERTLSSQTDNMIELLADDEIGLPDFTTKAMKFLSSINEDIGKDKSDTYKKVRKEVEDELKEGQPKEPTEPTAPTKGKEETNPEIKALMERIAALEKDKQESDKKASIAQKKRDLESKLAEKGVKDKEWLNDFLSEVNIDEDFDVDGKVETYLKIYNKSQANGGGAPAPVNPAGEPTENGVKIDDVVTLAKNNNIG